MKKIFKSSAFDLLKSKAVLAISGGMILASCGVQVGGYSESDGVYYDPAKDTLPEGVVVDSGNQVGEVYDYNKNSAVDKSKINEQQQRDRYRNWNRTSSSQSSDWGTYLGTDYSYSNYGGYSPFGMSMMFIPTYGLGFGYGSMMGYGYNPYMMGMYGYNPYSYGSYYGGYGYGYNPYYGGMYDSYYDPYYAYNPYRYGNYGNVYYVVPNKRSGADGRTSNGFYNSGNPYKTTNNTSSAPRQTYSNPRRFENNSYPSQQPNYNNSGFRNDNSGFRNSNSGGFGSQSSSSSSGSNGGFRRSGGFR